jgi:UDP-glucose 4-epimerase
MRVMVTGGAGYIGSVVAEVLLDRGHEVVVFDDLSTGHRRAVDPRAAFVRGRLHERPRLAAALREQGVEAVVHMAAKALVGESMADPALYYDNNIVGGLSLLGAMRDAGVRRIVFSSSAATFGEPRKQPVEEDDPQSPTNPYGQTKLAFEQILRWYAGGYGLASVSLRYFNAAGATPHRGEDHEPETHLIPRLLLVAAGADPVITIHGGDYPTRDGTCVRDYVHVVDLADAHLRALDAMAAEADGHGWRAYNLGCGGEGYTVLEVVEAARRVTGRELPVVTGPRRPGDPAVLVASSRRIREELGWAPRNDALDAIVRDAWAWMQAFPEGYGAD